MSASRAGVYSGVAGALTAGTGLVHATAAGAHGSDSQLGALFAVTAVVQVAVGAALVARPRRATLAATALVNVVVAGAWAASRLTGLPLVDGLSEAQPAGLQDVSATLMEAVAAGAALLAWRRPVLAADTRVSPVWALALLPALVGMTAPHSHSGEHVAGAGHVSDDQHATGDHHAASLAVDPIFAGADTSHVSEADLAEAKSLIVDTRRAVGRLFPDEASVVAAGYRSIGDGRFPGSFEHFVHAGYLNDGRELDPARIESIVLENTGAGKRVVSAMFILELGRTMADVPDIAGPLTAWHDHQNLCWDESGTRLAGLLLNGRCVPRGTFQPTPPMLHVWLQDHRCGPFAGIDGHGAVCTGSHGH